MCDGLPFLLFEGDNYYPHGGWEDFTGGYETVEAAQAASTEVSGSGRWAHVVDERTGEIVSHKEDAVWREGEREKW